MHTQPTLASIYLHQEEVPGAGSQSIASKLWGCMPDITYKSGSELFD